MIEFNQESILIVEDDSRDIQALELILEPQKYNLVFKDSGEEALEYLQGHQPDLILLDIMFPGISGFEVCQKIKEDKKISEIPVIFLSAKYDFKDVVKGFELGAVDYITKPFNPLELVSRIKSQLSLRRTKLELQQLNQTKDKLFSILSHDLRNPLVSIQSGLRLIYDRTDNKSKEWLDVYKHMVNISNSTFYLLNSVLDWSKTQMSELKPNPRQFSIEALINDILILFKGTAELNQVSIMTDVKPANIFMDRDMLNVVMRNLVANAVKFTPVGGSVNIKSENLGETLILTVQDTGVGLTQEQLERILSFNHHKDTDALMDFGQGMGLSICSELVDKLGGKMTASSKPDQGSIFTVQLPATI